jgi:hypothetical protein
VIIVREPVVVVRQHRHYGRRYHRH